jgi:AcrR family transcriptional regulator
MSRDQVILRAAAKLFYERSFAAVGVDEIGARAGVTGPAIYRHFKGKDEILATLFDEALDGLNDATAGGPEDADGQLRHLIEQHASFLMTKRELAAVWSREARSLADPYRRRITRRSQQYITRWIEVVQERHPELDEQQTESAVYATLGMLNSVHDWPDRVVRSQSLVETLTAQALAGLSGIGRSEA